MGEARTSHSSRAARQSARWSAVPVAVMLALLGSATPAHAADTLAPTTPGPVVAVEVATTSVTLAWEPSADDTAVTGYEVTRWDLDQGVTYQTAVNSMTIPGRSSWTYRFQVRALDAAGNSSPSTAVTTVTLPPGDRQAPTTPGVVGVSGITATSAVLTWGASTDNVFLGGYEVYWSWGGVFALRTVMRYPIVQPTTRLYDLVPNTTYTVAVLARDIAGNASPLSEPATFTTAAADTTVDITAPTAPGAPAVSALGPNGVTLTWEPSTDDTGVVRYSVSTLVESDQVLARGSTGPSLTLTDLEAGRRYVLAVQAVDAAGNRSPLSAAVVVTTPVATVPCCAVRYRIIAEWPGGFQAEVTIMNVNSYQVNGWKLGWTFPNGQRVSQLWSAVATSDGDAVTVTNPAWAPTVPTGGSYTFGFVGTRTATNEAPSVFTVNEAVCPTAG